MGLQIDVGDTVAFHAHTPDHTVTAYHMEHGRQQRVPDDADPFSSPVLPIGASWLYQFDQPGTYDINCAPHEFFGMVGRIVVGDPMTRSTMATLERGDGRRSVRPIYRICRG